MGIWGTVLAETKDTVVGVYVVQNHGSATAISVPFHGYFCNWFPLYSHSHNYTRTDAD